MYYFKNSNIKLEIIKDSASSFIIISNKKEFTLTFFKKDISGWDTSKVKRYLTYFTAIPFETWAFDLPENEKKSIESGPPIYRISVKQSTGEEIILTVWEKWNTAGGFKKADTDRVWAKTNLRDEIFIMRYFDLDPVLKKRTYFFTD